MSTGLNCWILEAKPGQWYYVLQSWRCPVGAWDWTDEDPTIVGPFASEAAATDSLLENEANPGGFSVVAYEKDDPKHLALAAKARRPRR